LSFCDIDGKNPSVAVNNSLLISMCILRDLPSQKNPKALCQGSSLILYVPTFLWKYCFSTKWERSEELKRELFSVRGDSCTHVFS
jgi:hypothetical protein